MTQSNFIYADFPSFVNIFIATIPFNMFIPWQTPINWQLGPVKNIFYLRILVSNQHYFPFSWCFYRLTLTRRVPLVKQLPKNPSSLLVFSVAQSLVFSVLWIIVCPCSFGHCIVCPSTCGFWLFLWYLPIFLGQTRWIQSPHCGNFPFICKIIPSVLAYGV